MASVSYSTTGADDDPSKDCPSLTLSMPELVFWTEVALRVISSVKEYIPSFTTGSVNHSINLGGCCFFKETQKQSAFLSSTFWWSGGGTKVNGQCYIKVLPLDMEVSSIA